MDCKEMAQHLLTSMFTDDPCLYYQRVDKKRGQQREPSLLEYRVSIYHPFWGITNISSLLADAIRGERVNAEYEYLVVAEKGEKKQTVKSTSDYRTLTILLGLALFQNDMYFSFQNCKGEKDILKKEAVQ